MTFIRSCSILTGASSFVSSRRREMRWTCVSTTTPAGMPNHEPRTTLAVLRAAPGTVRSSSIVLGTSPPKSLMILRAAPTMDFDLLRKNPVERMSGSSSSGLQRGEVLWRWIFLEQFRRDHVDAHVGALRGEDGCDQKFPCAVVVQGALDVGVELVEVAQDGSRCARGRGGCRPSQQRTSRLPP